MKPYVNRIRYHHQHYVITIPKKLTKYVFSNTRLVHIWINSKKRIVVASFNINPNYKDHNGVVLLAYAYFNKTTYTLRIPESVFNSFCRYHNFNELKNLKITVNKKNQLILFH